MCIRRHKPGVSGDVKQSCFRKRVITPEKEIESYVWGVEVNLVTTEFSAEIGGVANLAQCRNDAVTPMTRTSASSQRMNTPISLQESINDVGPNEPVSTGNNGRFHCRLLLVRHPLEDSVQVHSVASARNAPITMRMNGFVEELDNRGFARLTGSEGNQGSVIIGPGL
jgi:hypothetical protein